MSDYWEKKCKRVAKWKNQLGLIGESTHFTDSLSGIDNRVLIQGGWHSKDVADVQKLVSKKIPVQWSTEHGGIVEIGFNIKIGKFVGVHHVYKTVQANPVFENIKDCISWYMKQVKKIEKVEDALED